MQKLLRPAQIMVAVSIAGFGLVSLYFADFVSALQPMAKDKWPPALAYATGLVLLLAGAGIAIDRTARAAALLVAALLAVWIALLHVPILLVKPSGAAWVGPLECLTIIGIMLVVSALPGVRGTLPTRWDAWAANAGFWGRFVYGFTLIPAGIMHFIFDDFVAAIVPAWIPGGGMFWTLFTGGAMIAAGLAMMSGVLGRLAALLVGVMFASWVITLHIPRTLAAIGNRPEWTSLFIAILFTAGAWLIASTWPERAAKIAPH